MKDRTPKKINCPLEVGLSFIGHKQNIARNPSTKIVLINLTINKNISAIVIISLIVVCVSYCTTIS